jgi:predicted DNA-binding transcriptional regulator YafY
MQTLRRHRHPRAGKALAEELGVSLRTLYRDIASLQAQGAHIEGEAGLGYVLRPGFMLPPLMFSEEEIEALVLGSRWVAERTDSALAEAARNALAKIGSVLPPDLRNAADSSALLVGPATPATREDLLLFRTRGAIRAQHKLEVHYRDGQERVTARTLWPCAVGFFDHCLVLVAWCELREDFRHFRIDRIVSLRVLDESYPGSRQALVQRWRRQQGIRPR